jgi:hypothetical protein
VRAHAVEEHGSKHADVDLVVAPAPEVYFPGAALTMAGVVSGYVVPGLRADATGSMCVAGACEEYQSAQAYHDHNWGVWRGVTWEWGASRAGAYTLLYGRVQPDSARSTQPLFVYVTDSLGFLALFTPGDIRYDDGRTLRVGNETIRIPSRGVMTDVRGADTLRVELIVEDATATDTRTGAREGLNTRDIARPYFIQMKGRMRVTGRVSGRPIGGEGAGFFETYR